MKRLVLLVVFVMGSVAGFAQSNVAVDILSGSGATPWAEVPYGTDVGGGYVKAPTLFYPGSSISPAVSGESSGGTFSAGPDPAPGLLYGPGDQLGPANYSNHQDMGFPDGDTPDPGSFAKVDPGIYDHGVVHFFKLSGGFWGPNGVSGSDAAFKMIFGDGGVLLGALNRTSWSKWRQETGCQPNSMCVAMASPSGIGEGSFSPLAPEGGLAASELRGGHLLRIHVGLTEAELATRLAAEPNLRAASTFATRAEAEAAMTKVIDANQVQLSDWLGAGAPGRLRLDVGFSGGMVLERGATAAVPGAGARAILVGNGTGRYFFLTGFPTLP